MSYEDSDHGFQLYLRQIAQYPLLTPAQEVTLAAKIKKGNKAAKAEMIRANLRLVVKIARDYANLGLPLLDLISEGNIGLIKAVERFDPAKGGKLSTYGAWWIKQSIKRALANQGKTIRLPVHLVDKIAKIRRVGAGLSDELGREATDEEIAEEVGMNAGKVTQLINARFGLDGSDPITLEEVGDKFGVTRERIRQLQNIALGKMRRAIDKRERTSPEKLAKAA